MAEFSGKLSERVVVERRSIADDGLGGAGDSWETLCVRWAAVSPASRAETSRLAADTRLTSREWAVLLRRIPDVTLDMRLRWRALTLRLVGIVEDPGQPDRMTLLAEELGA